MIEKVKLKSKILIEQFSGYDDISINDIDRDFDYSYLNVTGLNAEERKKLEEDILNLIKIGSNKINSISLPSGITTIIPNVIKEAYTEDISFDNSDVYFEKMKNTPAKLASKGFLYEKLQAIKRNDEREISEFDLFKGTKILTTIGAYLANSIEEYEDIIKYMPSAMEIRIQVKNHEELKRVMALGRTNTTFLINKSDLDNLVEFDDKYSIQVRINNMSDLSIEELVKLKKKCNLTQINILSEKSVIGVDGEFGDSKSVYDMDTYAKLRRAVDDIIQGIDINASEIEKFARIYERMGHKITYDHEAFEYIKTDGKEGRENQNAYNLVGALLEDLSICDGISRSLKQVLSCVGIQAAEVHADPINKEQKWGHAWNRVKLDGIWYNADLTWDLENIKDGTNPQYCLQSSQEFMHDEYEVTNDEQVLDVTYNQEELFDKYFSGRRYSIETGEKVFFSSSELIKIVSNLKAASQYKSEDINITMYGLEHLEEGIISISNVFDGNEIQASYEGSSGILLESEQLARFITEYMKTAEYITSRIGEDGKTKIARHDGVNLVVDDELKQILVTQGIDVDDIIHPIYEIKTATLLQKIKDAKEDKLREGLGINIRAKENTSYELYVNGENKNYEISENELIDFLQKYENVIGITDVRMKGRSLIELLSDDGIVLTMYKEIKEELLETGCDLRSVFKEQENHKSEISNAEISQNVESQEQTAMIKHKESYIKKLVKRVKEAFYRIKEKGSKANAAEIQMINKSNPPQKKLPSWSLENWTQEEREEARAVASSEEKSISRTKNESAENLEK